mgnify:CR=1 FL=1
MDTSLPVPESITLLRANIDSYTQLEIDWTCDMTLVSSFEITLSTSPIFAVGNTTTKVYRNVLAPPLIVATILEQDIRKVPHYTKVRSVGDLPSKVGGESAPSIKWRNIGEKDQSCFLSTQFLNSTSLNPLDWECAECPTGVSCAGSVTSEEAGAMFGFASCPDSSLGYEACIFSPACNGAPNLLLRDKYTNTTGYDPAVNNLPPGCSLGYKNNSLLCSSCERGFSHSGGGLDGRCDKCPTPGRNVLIAVGGVLIGIVGLFVFVQLNLSDKGTIDPADGAKAIGLSFIQVISLLTSFPIAWPQVFVTLFKVGGAVAVLGQHFVNLKCLYPERSEAEVFYQIQIVWAIMPVVLPLSCALVWTVLSKCRDIKDLDTKIQSSIVGLLYLIWPTLCSTTFTLFSCRTVCGNTLFRVDLTETCWVGRHSSFAFGIGVPMLIIYIIGFPLATMVIIKRLQNSVQQQQKARRASQSVLERKNSMNKRTSWITNLKNESAQQSLSIETTRTSSKGHHRWFSDVNVVASVTASQLAKHEAFGMLYTSFREEVWWWEITTTVRKILIVAVGVFGESMGRMQVHFTALCIVLIMLITAIVQPYGKQIQLHVLELSSLAAIWLTLWAGSVFNSHPRCEDGKGGTLGWCDSLSVAIGILDIMSLVMVAFVMAYYKKQEQFDAMFQKMFERSGSEAQRMRLALEAEERRQRMANADVSENPSMLSIELTAVSENENGLPTGWEEEIDENSGDTYYYKTGDETGATTTWTRPTKTNDLADTSMATEGNPMQLVPKTEYM